MTTRDFLWSSWDVHPFVIGCCVAALIAYARLAGFRSPAKTACFVGAIAIFYLTLASPLSVLANSYLFSAHMLQHLSLLLIVPALVLLGLPKRKKFSRFHFHPLAGWAAGLSGMWVWHERTLCNAATTTPTVRTIQIISLVALGLMFWSPIAGPDKNRRLSPLVGVVYLFSSCVGCTILGILITFAPVGVVCPVYLHPLDPIGILQLVRGDWGITPAVDQKIGGLLMWVPACGIYLCGVIALLAKWYRTGETSREPQAVYPAPRPTGGNV